jgi:hypothetical protein
MSSTPANIVINFTSNVDNGCHNVYWGTVPGGPYPNSAAVSCPLGVGMACTAYLPITIDNETCDEVTYYGYIEACCNTIPAGQIPFSVTFTPAPPCVALTFTCNTEGGCAVMNGFTGCQGLIGEWDAKIEGESFSFCYDSSTTNAASATASAELAGYTVTEDPTICCYDCVSVRITYDGTAPARVQYLNCNSTSTKTSINFIGPATTQDICARRDSWATDDAAATFTILGPCP